MAANIPTAYVAGNSRYGSVSTLVYFYFNRKIEMTISMGFLFNCNCNYCIKKSKSSKHLKFNDKITFHHYDYVIIKNVYCSLAFNKIMLMIISYRRKNNIK